jgi:vacuolar-type H+-ATPase subunit I/STV1
MPRFVFCALCCFWIRFEIFSFLFLCDVVCLKGNARLNLAFVATIFAKFPEMIEETPKEPAEDKDKIIAELRHQVNVLTDEINQLKAKESDLLAELERLRRENQRNIYRSSLFSLHFFLISQPNCEFGIQISIIRM